ncbi:sulfite exporter TauE/SafE family protein [Abyssalbus ytuae]|uniref:Sulfite exporter TauE/SafE family protein n=1 Tax=Abyssalbus ytuae TaxID=2926907 RepID=A0A9E7CYY7_9FLAO|nr:sulfite exporter TauE/SafE family protein [Abyssalbus ytuae]UOB17110.1 sulfite exporter TauE/SafE family protein [Abyssalbus ytuae]
MDISNYLDFPLFAGILASILHVITGPDHLAAVIPFAIKSNRKGWKIGLLWGTGHLIGMLFIGLLFLFFKELIPVENISHYSEKLVGIILIGIGAWVFYKIFIEKKTGHKHLHFHPDNNPVIHSHPHDHSHGNHHNHTHEKNLKQSGMASLSIGIIHGLAGIAHFILFLPVLSFQKISDAVLYIVGFAIGIIIAMTSFTFLIGKVSDVSQNSHNENLFYGIRFSGGLFAIVVGVYWLAVT